MNNIIATALTFPFAHSGAAMSDGESTTRCLVSMNDRNGYWRWTVTHNGCLAAFCLLSDLVNPTDDDVPTLHHGIVEISSQKNLPDPDHEVITSSKKPVKPANIKDVMIFETIPGDIIQVRLSSFFIQAEGPFKTLEALKTSYAATQPGTAAAFRGEQ